MTRLMRLRQDLAARPTRIVEEPDRRQAAVALLLVPDPDRLLLIGRAERPGDPWSGQMALPGGRREAEDVDLWATARRETREEIGVVLPEWGGVALDDLAPVTPVLPPIVVRPFLVVLTEAPPIQPNAEVASYHWVELAALARADAVIQTTVSIPGGDLRVSGYRVGSGFLWGMTERIVTPVINRWRDLTD